uniref:Protein kinase domain-containing protein n=1 Tax=Haptolina brevifila TaxID=156173 RepID=A0A7S2NG04_9EUKA|mmetsp:Transcript_76796/g.152277  ORF Transcript_76796/g.152277 Transcript_76796/m.152277 type:complete len:619 (+) Transcript_76796:72-1928(+)
MADDDAAEALFEELNQAPPDQALQIVSRWLTGHKLDAACGSLMKEIASDPSKWGTEPPTTPSPAPGNASRTPAAAPPVGEALPVPGTSTRPGRLFDAEPIDPGSVPEIMLTKPDPIFFGERDDKKREQSATEEFPLTVHFDPLTSGLESETHFRVEEKQIIAGRYVVIQYLGSGTFCHTVQCEDLKARAGGAHRFVCVKVSKNTKDILDQNLWEVKLLKLLARRVNAEQRNQLPTLLNVFYYRETLFIVYELLRDNLYHIYKYIEECHLPKYFTVERLREVSRQCLKTLEVLHEHEVIHCDLKPENILIQSLTACQVKVIDYGNAYLHHDQRCSYVQSRAYRAPEVVLGHAYTPKVDLWSLGCILMELLTNRLLFDNRSVQSLLASHIALLGPMPERLLQEGQLSEHYFQPGREQTLVGKHDGRICRLRPTQTSLANLCERHGCSDPRFADFIKTLLALDPEKRGSAKLALQHPFLQATGPCPPYKLNPADKSGEAGLRLLQKYKSLENVESPARDKSLSFGPSQLDGSLLQDDDVPGPATPTSFREQCYLDRERLEKKRSRKSGVSRWTSSGSSGGGGGGSPAGRDGKDLPSSLDGMVISPKTPASVDLAKKGRTAD